MRFPWFSLVAALALSFPELAAAQPEPPPEGAEDAEPGEPGEPGEGDGEAEDGDPNAPGKRRAPTPEPEDDENLPEPPLTPPALDSIGGHLMISGSVLWAIPFASLEDKVDQTEFMSAGPGFGIEAGYGISRMVVLGLWGQGLFLDGSDDCSTCSTRSLAGGAFVRYHLVQGVRFDPWMSAGLGWRTTTIDPGQSGAEDVTYSGIEWLRLAVGGDWYAFQNFGFGPYFELDMGRYMSRSPGDFGSAANHWHFITGARVTFDAPGR
jgi:hypothetical protein